MKHEEFREIIPDYLGNCLAVEAKKCFEDHLSECTRCQKLLSEYRSIIKLEQLAAGSTSDLKQDLSESVMRSIKQEALNEEIGREVWVKTRRLVSSLAVVNITALLVLGCLLFSRNTQQDRTATMLSVIAESDAKYTPVAYRPQTGWVPVSFALNSSEAIKYFATPQTFVDVRIQFHKSGKQESMILGRLLKVVSVTSQLVTDPGTKTEYVDNQVTVLVPQSDVEQLNTLRLFGRVSLLPISQPVIRPEQGAGAAVLRDPSGRPFDIPLSQGALAVMYLQEKDTRPSSRLIYNGTKWQEEQLKEIQVF